MREATWIPSGRDYLKAARHLCPLDKYPFSEHYGWVQDKYGLSWQLILSNPEGEERPFIVPSLLFVGDVAGRAEEAINHYLSVFKNSKMGALIRYGAGQEPDKEGTLMFADFILEGQWFAAVCYPGIQNQISKKGLRGARGNLDWFLLILDLKRSQKTDFQHDCPLPIM